jgi:CcmD family protein
MFKKSIAFLVSLICFTNLLIAQPSITVDKTFDAGAINKLKQGEQIYIVIGVIAIILIGLFLYLWRLDKKITRLEKQV